MLKGKGKKRNTEAGEEGDECKKKSIFVIFIPTVLRTATPLKLSSSR
jgi:hypothetical protein